MHCNQKARFLMAVVAAAVMPLWAGSCVSESNQEVVVYAALDREFSQPILDDFARETGIEVRAKFDTEATKTVGLAEAIVAQRDRPRCDLFWNNEILNTIRLEREGLLEPYVAAEGPDGSERSPPRAWQAIAARARILLVNTRIVGKEERPRGIRDLADPKWRGRTGMAKPLFGTTATHAACLFAVWGEADAKAFFRACRANEVQVLSGNKQVAVAVATGRLAFGLTDTDDAIGQIQAGEPVEIVYPDQEPGGLGTLYIPNTLALIANRPHPEGGRRLMEALLQPGVEERLSEGASAQVPLNPKAANRSPIEPPGKVRAMEVDWSGAADRWPEAMRFLREEFGGGG